MTQNLTANPAVNKILEKLNSGYQIEGRSMITKETLAQDKQSAVLFPEKIPMQGLIHITEGRGVSRKDINDAYWAQKPSVFKTLSLQLQSFFKK